MISLKDDAADVKLVSKLLQEAAASKELVLREEAKQYPRRTENSWRPAPLLCKRFDLLDPFAGKVKCTFYLVGTICFQLGSAG